jgi:uncharacterized repeat protein (TIGR02543 family)
MKPIRRVFLLFAALALAAGLAAFTLSGSARDALASTGADRRYAVVYEANGGAGVVTGDVPLVGTPLAIKDGSGLVRTGWRFDGWNTEPDGSGKSYAPGQVVCDIAPPDGTVTLYARWIRDAAG